MYLCYNRYMKQIITVQKTAEAKIEIKRSEFYSYIAPVDSEKSASEFVSYIKKEHHKASHHPYAYITGIKERLTKTSDDGEPAQTAGRPILGVLEANNLTNVVLVSARYFGGIKLGAGGLNRAYSQSAAHAVKAAVFVQKVFCSVLLINIKYSLLDKVSEYFRQRDFQVLETSFTESAMVKVAVPVEMYVHTCEDLNDLASGDLSIEIISEEYIDKIISEGDINDD